jgi:signal transduction histidine kinase
MEAILNEELNQVFENAAVALILVDKEGRIKLINKAGEDLFGQGIVDVKGKLAGEAFKCVHAFINDYVVCGKTEECPNCPLRNSFEDTYNTGENHYKVHGNLDIQGEDSTYQLFLLISTSLLNVTSNKYVLLTIEDITKEIDLQNELKERGKELEELIATRNKFFTIIAYDLINSFSTIEGFAKLLLEESSSFTTEERESFLQLIVNSSQNTNRSLENLILWSRLQVGNMDYVLENVNIVDLINDTVSQLRTMAEKKNINIEVSLPEQLCLTLDKFMISTVLRNLITNAIKYTHKSGSISINLEEKEGRIQVSVKDNGIGIYKENIAKLFKITEKFSMQGTEQEEGTGLGLILSKGFIDLHNGEIMVESQIGKGSTFTFTLPL